MEIVLGYAFLLVTHIGIGTGAVFCCGMVERFGEASLLCKLNILSGIHFLSQKNNKPFHLFPT